MQCDRYPGKDLEQKEDINGKTSEIQIKSTVYLIVNTKTDKRTTEM